MGKFDTGIPKKLECSNPECPFSKRDACYKGVKRKARAAWRLRQKFYDDKSWNRRYIAKEKNMILNHNISNLDLAKKLHRSQGGMVLIRRYYKNKLLER